MKSLNKDWKQKQYNPNLLSSPKTNIFIEIKNLQFVSIINSPALLLKLVGIVQFVKCKHSYT